MWYLIKQASRLGRQNSLTDDMKARLKRENFKIQEKEIVNPFDKDDTEKWNETYIELNSMKDLERLRQCVCEDLIYGYHKKPNHIVIYDDWIE